MENTAKIAALEVHVELIRKEIDRLEATITTMDKELDVHKSDLQGAIAQCKGIVSQVAEISASMKNIGELSIEVEACKQERKDTIWKFIRDNPEKSIKITAVVAFILFLISLKNFELVALFLKLIGVK